MPFAQTLTIRQETVKAARQKMKIEIEFDLLKRIAKATPELTMAQFVAVWTEKLSEEKRERDRERKSGGKGAEEPGIAAEQHGMPPTREEQERQLYDDGNAICGSNARGMVALLLKHHRFDMAPVRAVLEQARVANDPRAYVAAQCRKVRNGTGASTMEAFDDLISRSAGETVGAGAEVCDVGPRSAQGR